MSDYPAGTVAVATVRGVPNVRVMRHSTEGWVSAELADDYQWHTDNRVTDVRPLVVLDLDLAAHIGVGKLIADLRTGGFYDIADQIEAQTRPPKPEVYEHLVYQQRGKTAESVCGKAWIPGADVIVAGKCPECLSVAEGGWTA